MRTSTFTPSSGKTINHMTIGTMNRRIRATPRVRWARQTPPTSPRRTRERPRDYRDQAADDRPEEEHSEHAEDDRNATHESVASGVRLTAQPPRSRGAHCHPDSDRKRPGEASERTDDADRCGDEEVHAPAEWRKGGRDWRGCRLSSHGGNVARGVMLGHPAVVPQGHRSSAVLESRRGRGRCHRRDPSWATQATEAPLPGRAISDTSSSSDISLTIYSPTESPHGHRPRSRPGA